MQVLRGLPRRRGCGFALVAAKPDFSDLPEPAAAIQLAREGDPLGFQYLYLRYADSVFSYVKTIVGERSAAEDVTQEVFTKLMTSIGRYEEQAAPFAGWLLRVARNAAIDHLRRNRPLAEADSLADATDGCADERRWVLDDALASLPSDQREVLVLRHVVGLTPAETAARMKRSKGSIHGLHHRARRTMQRLLRQMDAAPAAPSR